MHYSVFITALKDIHCLILLLLQLLFFQCSHTQMYPSLPFTEGISVSSTDTNKDTTFEKEATALKVS